MGGWKERLAGKDEKLTRNIKLSCFIFKGRGEGILELIHEDEQECAGKKAFERDRAV